MNKNIEWPTPYHSEELAKSNILQQLIITCNASRRFSSLSAIIKTSFIEFVVSIILTIFLYGSSSAAEQNNTVKDNQAEVTLLGGSYLDNKIQLGLNVKMKQGWHIYWRSAGDTGFPPVLDWSSSNNIDGAEFMWPTPKRLVQELSPGNFVESYVYENEVTFPITIIAQDRIKPVDINLHISYAICAELCIPGLADLRLTLQPGYKSDNILEQINHFRQLVPKTNGTYGLKIESVNKNIFDVDGKQLIEVTAISKNKTFSSDATILVEGSEHFLFKNPTSKIDGNTAIFTMPVIKTTDKDDFLNSLLNVTLINGLQAVELATSGDSIASTPTSNTRNITKNISPAIILMLAFGFIGGLILNIMPCVLPILSIKLLGVIKHGGSKNSDVTASFLLTSLGIMVSFIVLAIITIWLKQAGEVIGWGLHFQQPYFIISLVIILTLFTANMWGFYEVSFPRKLGGIGSKYEGKLRHFMSGVFATILATPCTAPFLGVAVGFAVSRGAIEILSIFIAMGLGLASPYLLFSIFPSMVTKLPKPGKWMINIKKLMGILIAFTAVWLIWVLSNQLGKIAAIVLFALCVVKVLKLWAANHFIFMKKVQIPLLIIIIFLSFTIPIKVSKKSDLNTSTIPHEIWEDFKPEDINKLVENGKIVFVDITADWCLTCKVNKLVVLDNSEIKEIFSKMDVVAMNADWTNRDAKIGKYLMKYERAGIPFNIIYGPNAPDGIVLSELMSKKEVLAALQKALKK